MNVDVASLGREAARRSDELWTTFAAASDAAFVQAWLALQCQTIALVRSGLVLFETGDGGGLAPVAAWPHLAMDFTGLRAVSRKAVDERTGVVLRPKDEARSGLAQIAYPIALDDHVSALVVIELGPVDDRGVQEALRLLHWGVGWVEAEILKRRSAEDRGRLARSAFALDVVAVAGEDPRVEATALAIANEVALRLGCERVSIALVARRAGRGARLALAAMSHMAYFRRKASLVAALENAMEEALDQSATVAEPAVEGVAGAIAVAHRAYAGERRIMALASVVVSHRGVPCGVMTLERRQGPAFDRDALLTAEAVAELVGPMLDLKRSQRRWVSGRLPEAIGNGLRAVLGPRRQSLKLAILAGAAFLAFAALFPATFRISAAAVLEGEQQRAAVAPFEGFVAATPHRAGDVVKAGDVLVSLDDGDLKLDASKWRSEYAQLVQQQRKAMASLDRAEVGLIEARLEQARAQVELAAIKLSRASIVAPIDGVVISGDWNQKLGAPVEQGALLFEIAPLSSYRVGLKVDERDIGALRVGQTGELLLVGSAGAALPIRIDRITSIATVEDGGNVFRVEAAFLSDAPSIRPGMEGLAKIAVDRRPIGWIWTRRLVDWLRVAVWEHTP